MPLPRTEAKLAGSITGQESLTFIMWASQQAKTRTLFLPMEKSNDCCERYYDLVSVMFEYRNWIRRYLILDQAQAQG